MKMSYPKNAPFDPITGDLLPDYRDAYLLGQLTPVPQQQVESYLKRSPIQSKVLLGRYRELAAKAEAAGHTLVPPHWVQQRLLRQASVSAAGPFRRPVVRLALGVLLALGGASVVQWLRNEPLVPAPVAAAVVRAASSASQATQRFVQRFSTPPATDSLVSAPVRRVAVRPARKPAVLPLATAPTKEEVLPLPSRRTRVAPLPTDSLAPTLPIALAPSGATAPTATGSPRPMHGRISDAQGRPLAGATVLVPGTRLVTSTDAGGNYALDVPAGAALQFGYGGYDDQVVRSSIAGGALNITLQPQAPAPGRARRKR